MATLSNTGLLATYNYNGSPLYGGSQMHRHKFPMVGGNWFVDRANDVNKALKKHHVVSQTGRFVGDALGGFTGAAVKIGAHGAKQYGYGKKK